MISCFVVNLLSLYIEYLGCIWCWINKISSLTIIPIELIIYGRDYYLLLNMIS